MTEVERITDLNKIVFPKLGWSFSIDTTAFTVFGMEIKWYGLIITCGLFLAMLYCFPKMKRFGLDSDRVIDVVICGVLGGIVGARIYYVINEWDEYAGNWKEIFNTRNGGLAIYGGLIGAVLIGLIVCEIRKVRKLPMLDIASIGFLIGQGVGRWGNFVNQEAFGTNTDSLFGMTGGTIQQSILNQTLYLDGSAYEKGVELSEKYAVHPCFLYESVWCLLGFVFLAWFSKRRKYDGQIFLMYLAWYGSERFIVEGLRTDSLMAGNIRVSQALSAVLFVVSVILLIVFASKVRRDPEAFVLYCNTEESKQLLEEAERLRNGEKPDKKAENAETSAEEQNKSADDNKKDEEIQEDSENGSDN